MRVRIRGHYRIDADGKVVPVVEKWDSVLPYEASPSGAIMRRPNQWYPRFVELSVLLAVIGVLIGATLIIIPRVRRAVATAQAAQAASARALIVQQQARHAVNPPRP